MSETPTPTTLADLAKAQRDPSFIDFKHDGKDYHVEVKKLSADEWAEYLRHSRDNVKVPERKPQMDRGRPVPVLEKDRYDYDHPDYLAECRKADELQIAYLLDKGLPGGIKGATLDEKVQWLNANLSISVMNALARGVALLSGGTIELANFTTGGV